MTPEEFLRDFGPMLGQIFMTVVNHQNEDGSVFSAQGGDRYAALAFSLTNHFVAALMACNPHRGERLWRTLRWLVQHVPETSRDVNRTYLNQLEVILLLNPSPEELDALRQPRDLVNRLLKKLIAQRSSEGDYAVEGLSPALASLWAIKLLKRARGIGVPLAQDETCFRQMHQDIDRHLRGGRRTLTRDRDCALGIRLRYDLHGQLLKPHMNLLVQLVSHKKNSCGLWDISEGLLRQIPPLGSSRSITFTVNPDDDVRHRWRDAFVSTCYVIENLAPLRKLHPKVSPALDNAMQQLCTFFLRDAPKSLYTNFDWEYDQLQIMCRFLVASQAYSNGQLQPYLFTLLVDSVPKNSLHVAPDRIDVEGALNALHQWLRVEHEGEVEPLTRGFSGARVIRIQPRLVIPPATAGIPAVPVALPFESVIVKYGPRAELETEVKNYQRLPHRVQSTFAALRITYHDKAQDRVFAVIQDLMNFVSLEEHLLKTQVVMPRLPPTLSEFLQDFHKLDRYRRHRSSWDQHWPARQLYFEPLWRYVESAYSLFNQPQIQAQLRRQHGRLNDLTAVQERERELRHALAQLYQHEVLLNHFPAVYMHGDLHTRNIMLWLPEENEDHIEFKFIDLEKFLEGGDYACDIGELCVSLKVLETNERCERAIQQFAGNIRQTISDDYLCLATTIKDRWFPARLALSEARTWLRIAHGKSKEGGLRLREGKVAEATDIAVDVLALADFACRDMNRTCDLLNLS
jgi:hypothetical protein